MLNTNQIKKIIYFNDNLNNPDKMQAIKTKILNANVPENFRENFNYLVEHGYKIVKPCDFYYSIFPYNEIVGKKEPRRTNAIYRYAWPKKQENGDMFLSKNSKKFKAKLAQMPRDQWDINSRLILNNDNDAYPNLDHAFYGEYEQFVDMNPFAICSGLSFIGRRNRMKFARYCHALIVDLDDVGAKQLENLMLGVFREETIDDWRVFMQYPTYIVLSGEGLHLYWVFQHPIALTQQNAKELLKLKTAIIDNVWTKPTSKCRSKQYSGLNQPFRMVGSLNSKENHFNQVVAFKIANKITHINDLNKWVRPDKRANLEPTKTPQHNEALFIKKSSKDKKEFRYKTNPGFYHWLIKNYTKEIVGGHRFHFMASLVSAAIKCGIPKEQYEKDIEEVFHTIKHVNHSNDLTLSDYRSALKLAKNPNLHRYTRKTLSRLIGVEIPTSRRNFRKRPEHIKIMNLLRDQHYYKDKEWRNLNGRPTKQDIVKEWRKLNPDGTKYKCIKETKLDKKTVYKWWET